jgi:hypothetical protein
MICDEDHAVSPPASSIDSKRCIQTRSRHPNQFGTAIETSGRPRLLRPSRTIRLRWPSRLQIRIPIIRPGDPIREFRIDGDLPSQGPQRRYSVHHEGKPLLAAPQSAGKKSIELRAQFSLEIGVARDLVDDVAVPPAYRRVFGAQRVAVDGHAVVDEVQCRRWGRGEDQPG